MSTISDDFWEILNLVIYGVDETDMKIARQAVEMFKSMIKDDYISPSDKTKFYITIADEILNNEIDMSQSGEETSLLRKFKDNSICQEDPSMLDDLESIIKSRTMTSNRRRESIRRNVKNWISMEKTRKVAYSLNAKYREATKSTDPLRVHELMQGITADSKKMNDLLAEESDSNTTVDFIDFNDEASIERGIVAQDSKRNIGRYKTGFQGINEMYGGGFCPGEFFGVAALSHNYKTGIMLDITRGAVSYNKPIDVWKNGKPLCWVFISLENDTHENLDLLFNSMYIANEGLKPGDDVNRTKKIQYIKKEFNRRGITLLMYRKIAHVFTADDYIELHEKLRGEWNIVGSTLDYLTMMGVSDSSSSNDSIRLQEMCSKIKSYCGFNKIIGITGFQLDAEAQKLADSGTSNVVKKFGPAHFAACKGIIRELDMLMFAHIETNLMGQAFLTMKWGKHRGVHDVPPHKKYCAYKFREHLGLEDDINLENPKYTRDIFALEEEEEQPLDVASSF